MTVRTPFCHHHCHCHHHHTQYFHHCCWSKLQHCRHHHRHCCWSHPHHSNYNCSGFPVSLCLDLPPHQHHRESNALRHPPTNQVMSIIIVIIGKVKIVMGDGEDYHHRHIINNNDHGDYQPRHIISFSMKRMQRWWRKLYWNETKGSASSSHLFGWRSLSDGGGSVASGVDGDDHNSDGDDHCHF